jgi:hypothetical protein
MSRLATVSSLAAGFAFLPLPDAVWAQAPEIRTHDTFLVQFDVFDNGFLGAGAAYFSGSGFTFGGQTGLYEGQLLVGVSEEQVCGEAYAGASGQEDFNWVNTAPFDTIRVFDAPYEAFDEGYRVAFDCSGDPDPLLIEVVERSYSDTGDPYVVLEFEVFNRGTTDMTDVYVGLFADLDVGDFTRNLADFDDATDLLYVWDDTATNPNYYGMAALGVTDHPGADVSGYEFFDEAPTETWLYYALTNGGWTSPPPVEDQRTVLGTGPYDIPAEGSIVTKFAFVAGLDEADIIANAKELFCLIECWPPAAEPTVEAAGLVLHEAYPNPSRGATMLALTLAAPQHVRLAVYDVLGREAVVLYEGPLPAGRRAFDLDGAMLPTGVYVVRLEAEGGTVSRPFTRVR